MSLIFERADLLLHRDVLTRFNVDYLNWISDEVSKRFGVSLAELLGAPIPQYVDGALAALCDGTPPSGVFYVAKNNNAIVGMGGLRRVCDGTAEIKRIYVSPAARGGGVGAQILDRLMADARVFGFQEVVMDTGSFMTSAHRIYEAVGFVDIPPYPQAEVPEALHHDWRFMRCRLT